MRSWREDPELVRTADEDVYQEVIVEDRWEQVFTMIESQFVGDGMGIKDRMVRATLRGMIFQAKKKVAADPEATRAYVIGAMYAIAAALRIEPRELFPDLSPAAEPAVAK